MNNNLAHVLMEHLTRNNFCPAAICFINPFGIFTQTWSQKKNWYMERDRVTLTGVRRVIYHQATGVLLDEKFLLP